MSKIEHSKNPIVVALYYCEGTKDIILEETLRAEGFPYARINSLADLNGAKVLVVGETPLLTSQLDDLAAFVKNGGVLVAFRPDEQLTTIFGVEDTGLVQKDGYIILNGDTPYEKVSYKGRLQLFGFSKLYAGGKTVVNLSPHDECGGIIYSQFGEGTVFIVAYDFPTTLLTIQQPDSAVGRAYDTWRVKVGLADVPQLDLMRRLFVNLILESIAFPLPRKWYFPRGYKALALLSGDQDGADYRMMSAVKSLITSCPVPYTLFATPKSQPLSRTELQEMVKSGIEIAVHPDFVGKGCSFTEEEFKKQLRKAEEDTGAGIVGARNHGLRWQKVVDMPLWMEKNGVQYDSNLGCRIPTDEAGAELPKLGYFVGCGLPFFFIHPKSFRRIDVLEEPLLVSDDLLWMKTDRRLVVDDVPSAAATFIAGMGLSQDEAFQLAKRFMDASLEKYYTVQCYDFHPLYLWEGTSDGCFKKIVKYAKERGVLLLSQGEWNNFWRGREEAQYNDLNWNPVSKTLKFTVQSKRELKGISFIVPLKYQGLKAEVSIDGSPVLHREEVVNEGQYALFTTDLSSETTRIAVSYI